MRWKPPLAEMSEPLEVIANAGNVPITPRKLVEPGRDDGSGPSRNHLESAAIGGARTTRSTRSFTGFMHSCPRVRLE